MKAALVKEDKTLKAGEIDTPVPGRDEVLVKVAYCGLCGSDIHMLEAGLFRPGCVIGHEISGTVAETGADVQGFKEGDRVAVFPLDPCGNCSHCKRGEIQHCTENITGRYGIGLKPGGFARYMVVKPGMLFKLPDSLDLKTAALTEPLAVSLRGVNLSGIGEGAHSFIMGAGPIGLFCIPFLKTRNTGRIFVADPNSFRTRKAEQIGADFVFDPKKNDPGAFIKDKAGSPPPYIFECAGTADSMQEAAYIADSQGRIIVLGLPQGNISILPIIWLNKELTLHFSLGYNYDEFRESMDLLAKGTAADPDVIISRVVPLDEVDSIFRSSEQPDFVKVLVDCS